MPELSCLPSEAFFQHCFIGFEGDETAGSRLPKFFGDCLVWASDAYHHDGSDVWEAIETMEKYELPVENQTKYLGENARRLYNIKPPKNIIRERVTEISRPEWWPSDKEVQESLNPLAALKRV